MFLVLVIVLVIVLVMVLLLLLVMVLIMVLVVVLVMVPVMMLIIVLVLLVLSLLAGVCTIAPAGGDCACHSAAAATFPKNGHSRTRLLYLGPSSPFPLFLYLHGRYTSSLSCQFFTRDDLWTQQGSRRECGM